MKKLTAIFMLVLAAAAGHAALPQPDLLVRAYFAGVQKISAAPDVNSFTNEFCSAPALALRNQTANKLSVWLAAWLQTNNAVTVPDGAARLRPLFDDLQKSEWMLEAHAAAAAKPEVALAIKLDGEQSLAWQAALKPFFPAASFTTSDDWLIFDSGTGAPSLGVALAKETLNPPASCFNLDLNWPHLVRWFPELSRLGLPETAFTVTAPDTNFRIEGKFLYPAPLSLNLESWKFPTNLVHNPLISFTAVRGFSSWLQAQDWAQLLQITPPPNQAFTWVLSGLPFLLYAAVPVPDAGSGASQVVQHLEPAIASLNSRNLSPFQFSMQNVNGLMSLVGMPMAVPYIQPISGPSGQFLLFGGFPLVPHGKPLPPKLFERLATPNILFYHWEITAERVPVMLEPFQLALFGTGHTQLDVNSAGLKWITNSAPRLGNSDTEITQVAPDQLAFHRLTPGIFTAAEMYALALWLEAANFPGCDLQSPGMARTHHFHPMAPVAVPPPPAK